MDRRLPPVSSERRELAGQRPTTEGVIVADAASHATSIKRPKAATRRRALRASAFVKGYSMPALIHMTMSVQGRLRAGVE